MGKDDTTFRAMVLPDVHKPPKVTGIRNLVRGAMLRKQVSREKRSHQSEKKEVFPKVKATEGEPSDSDDRMKWKEEKK